MDSVTSSKNRSGIMASLNPLLAKKLLMAVSGILFCLFLLVHLAGNSLLYLGANVFNTYANVLESTVLVYVAEAGLLFVIVLHIWMAILVSIDNKKARPIKYKVHKTAGKSTLMSRYMLHSGIIILAFMILHVANFKFGEWDNSLVKYNDTLYDLVVKRFSSLWYSVLYVVCMVFVGMHLFHAIKSALITLGLSHKSTFKLYSRLSAIFALVIATGFASFPIYFYLKSIL